MPCTWKKGGRVKGGKVGARSGGWGVNHEPSKMKKILTSVSAIFLRFFFFLCEQLGVIQECPHTRQCVRGRASITWRRQECLWGKKDERLKCVYWEKKDGLRRWVEEVERHHCLAWMCSCRSECACVIEGERADRRSQPERLRQSQGSFVISPICSFTLSAEALVTLRNTCRPSGFPATAKAIVAHCGWCNKERRKTRGGLQHVPATHVASSSRSGVSIWLGMVTSTQLLQAVASSSKLLLLQLFNRSSSG